jgi:aspartate/methionine/tyrosine aminotransferase
MRTDSPRPFALERYFARHEFNSRYLLSTSDCRGLAMADLVADADPELRRRWETLRLGYTESQGLPELREEIASLYRGVTQAEVLVAAPEEIVFLLINALLEPGNHVVCTFPGYQSLYELALSRGCEVTFWQAVEADDWRFPLESLQACLHRDSKLVVCNFPHNPTGALPSGEDFSSMLAAAESVGAWVFSDEMYRLLESADEIRLPAAAETYARAVSLSGMSKVFGLAGLRIGWAVTRDRELLKRMNTFKDYTTICSSAPSELLALMALRQRSPILWAHRDRVSRNVESATYFFGEHKDSLAWIPPQGGTVCFPRLLGGEDAETFCARVLRDTGVLLLPSTVYDYGREHFRLGLGREDFADGLQVLDAYLRGQREDHPG